MPDSLVYVLPVLVLIALTCIDTAIVGKFRPLRGSDRGWPVSKRSRLFLASIGVAAIVAVIVLWSSRGR